MSIFRNLFKSQEEIDESRRQKLHEIYVEFLRENERKSIKLENELPIVKANKKIESALNFFELKLKQIEEEWKEFGSTRLTFLEYLLIGVASSAFPNTLLNIEGQNR